MTKGISLLICLFLISPLNWAATATSSTSIGPAPNLAPRSETTSIPTSAPRPYQVSKSGSNIGIAQCGPGEVMVGFSVSDSNNAYVTYAATTNLGTDCAGFHFHYTNYFARLIQSPNQLTFTLYCQPINMGF